MNTSVFGKTMNNVRKHRDIKLVTTNKKRSRLVAKQNYHTAKWFSEGLLPIEKNETELKINKPMH